MPRLRRVIAAGLLAICLLAVPGTAHAWIFERGDGRAAVELEPERMFWQELWQRIQAFWLKDSVLIDPMGDDAAPPPPPADGS